MSHELHGNGLIPDNQIAITRSVQSSCESLPLLLEWAKAPFAEDAKAHSGGMDRGLQYSVFAPAVNITSEHTLEIYVGLNGYVPGFQAVASAFLGRLNVTGIGGQGLKLEYRPKPGIEGKKFTIELSNGETIVDLDPNMAGDETGQDTVFQSLLSLIGNTKNRKARPFDTIFQNGDDTTIRISTPKSLVFVDEDGGNRTPEEINEYFFPSGNKLPSPQ